MKYLSLLALTALTLTSCAQALHPPALPATQLRSQSASAGLSNLYQQYRALSWEKQADAKHQLLQRLSSLAPARPRGSQLRSPQTLPPEVVAVAVGLFQEYRNLSWTYDAQRKQELLEAVKAFDVPEVGEGLFQEYANLSWTYDTQRKNQFLELLSQFSSPKVLQGLYQEYNNLSWTYDAQRKRQFLTILTRMGMNLQKQ